MSEKWGAQANEENHWKISLLCHLTTDMSWDQFQDGRQKEDKCHSFSKPITSLSFLDVFFCDLSCDEVKEPLLDYILHLQRGKKATTVELSKVTFSDVQNN